jgi:hypothetical protein
MHTTNIKFLEKKQDILDKDKMMDNVQKLNICTKTLDHIYNVYHRL